MSSLLGAELARNRVSELRAAAERANGYSGSGVAAPRAHRSGPRFERLRSIAGAGLGRWRGGARAGYLRGERAGNQ
jgi:hypothetical protein